MQNMLDTHAVARSLTDADFTPAQADVLVDALRQAAEQGDPVTADQFRADLAEVRTEIAALGTRLSTQVAEVRTEITGLDTRLSTQVAEVRTEIAGLDTRLSTQVAGVRTEIAGLDTRLSTRIAEARTEVANLETRLVRWMVGTVIATAGVTIGVLRLFG